LANERKDATTKRREVGKIVSKRGGIGEAISGSRRNREKCPGLCIPPTKERKRRKKKQVKKGSCSEERRAGVSYGRTMRTDENPKEDIEARWLVYLERMLRLPQTGGARRVKHTEKKGNEGKKIFA